MTNRQRRFIRKLYKKGSMSFDYLDQHYPDIIYDKELCATSFEKYIMRTNDNSGIEVTVEGIEELQDFHRYLIHWRIPVILSIISIVLSALTLLLKIGLFPC